MARMSHRTPCGPTVASRPVRLLVFSPARDGKTSNVPQPTAHQLAVRMADLARALAPPRSIEDILAEVTAAAVELIDGVDTAGILVIKDDGGFDSLAATSEVPHQLDISADDLRRRPVRTGGACRYRDSHRRLSERGPMAAILPCRRGGRCPQRTVVQALHR